MKLVIAFVCLGTSACAMNASSPNTGQKINIDHRNYIISQLTAGTWIASTSGTPTGLSPEARSALLAAIEKASGCMVTDTSLSRQGLQLDAQVDCGGRMKN